MLNECEYLRARPFSCVHDIIADKMDVCAYGPREDPLSNYDKTDRHHQMRSLPQPAKDRRLLWDVVKPGLKDEEKASK